jgi:uncharacterized protein YhaN
MSDHEEKEKREKEKGEKFRQELSWELARLIQGRLPDLPVPLGLIQRRVHTKLRSEMLEYDLTQRSPNKEMAEMREAITGSVLGILTHFGENIDELVDDERKRRRVTNAAIQAAADAEYDFIEMMREGPDWDATASIERRTNKVIRQHSIQNQVFVYSSIAGVAILAVIAGLSLISWIVALIIAAGWVIGIRAGTRFLDIHDH